MSISLGPRAMRNVTRDPSPVTVPDQLDGRARLLAPSSGVTVAVNVPSALISRTARASTVYSEPPGCTMSPCQTPARSRALGGAASALRQAQPPPRRTSRLATSTAIVTRPRVDRSGPRESMGAIPPPHGVQVLCQLGRLLVRYAGRLPGHELEPRGPLRPDGGE